MRFLLIIILFLPQIVFSQKGNSSGEIFCTVDYSGKQMIRVKFLYNSVYEPRGFDLYRQKEGGSNWTKVNSQPILPNKNLSASSKLDKESKDFHKAIISTPFDSLKINPVRVFFIIKAIYDTELAEIIGVAYNDEGVVNGETYIYKLTVSNQTEAITLSRPIKMQNYAKVTAPVEVKAKRSKKRIDFNWKPDIYSYYAVDVYRKKIDETDFVKITKIPRAIQADEAEKYSAEKSIFYQDTSIRYDDNYVYKFKSIDYFGQESEFSEEITVPAADFIPPAAPFNLNPIASSLNGFIRLEYQLVDEPDLAGVNIYETSNPDKFEFKKVNTELVTKDKLSYVHTNLPVGGHYYRITSVDIAGNENPSDVVFAEVRDITPPEKPKGLTSESGEGYITLKWEANSESDLAGYHVERALKKESDKSASYIAITTKPITELIFTEKLSRNIKNEFVYRIVAIDTNYNRSKPSENTLAKMPDVIAPLQPLIKNVVCDTFAAVITWLPNVDLDLEGYNVYRRLVNDSLSIEKINFSLVPNTVNSYTDRSLKSGTAYEYLLEAVDGADNKSIKSKAYFAKTLQSELRANISLESKKINEKKKTVTFEWKMSGTADVKGFVVYAKNEKGLYKPVSGLTKENRAVIKTDGEKYSEFYIKGYTNDGRFIESDKFNTTEQ